MEIPDQVSWFANDSERQSSSQFTAGAHEIHGAKSLINIRNALPLMA
jgi:hypothetical protein